MLKGQRVFATMTLVNNILMVSRESFAALLLVSSSSFFSSPIGVLVIRNVTICLLLRPLWIIFVSSCFFLFFFSLLGPIFSIILYTIDSERFIYPLNLLTYLTFANENLAVS